MAPSRANMTQGAPGQVLLVSLVASDLQPLALTSELLARFDVSSAERTLPTTPGEIPDFLEFAREVVSRHVKIVIAASHDAPVLATLAAALDVPIIRVPVPRDASPAAALGALREQTPVATVALGEAGARNAALLAVSILALTEDRLRAAWHAFRADQTAAVLRQPPPAG